jgi:hypothetical protein
MNAETILTGIVTGVFTGGITGYLAALYAMRQFKAQRAFDKQLEWYERTSRALGTLQLVEIKLHYAERSKDHDQTMKASDELEKGLFDLVQCCHEAHLYAEQSSYEQLQTMGAKYGSDREINDKRITEMWHDTLIELSKPVRKMLGLKEIVLPASKKRP